MILIKPAWKTLREVCGCDIKQTCMEDTEGGVRSVILSKPAWKTLREMCGV